MTFKKWVKSNSYRFSCADCEDSAEAAYLAGQASIEQRVKAQAGEIVGYHFSYTTPFGHVVWDIDHTPRPDAIEVYPVVRTHPTTERPYNPLNDYAVISMNPTTEPVKAQAGEPIYGMAQQRQLNPSPQVRSDVGSLGNTYPTTERPYNPLNDYATIPMNTTERRVIPEDVLSWIDGVLPVIEIFGTTPSQKQWSKDRAREAREYLRNALNAAPAPTKGEV